MKHRLAPFVILLILTIFPITYAYTISGSVYNWELRQTNAVIELYSAKDLIAKKTTNNSEFHFEASKGNYTLIAKKYNRLGLEMRSEENITLKQDIYIDLVMFPIVDELMPQDNFDFDIIEPENYKSKTPRVFVALIILIVLSVLIAIKLIRKKGIKLDNKKNKKDKKNNIKNILKKDGDLISQDDDLKTLITIISSLGKKTTQKEIRKRLPLSEAKISMMLTLLEKENKIKKIKKGRGNIIILLDDKH